MNPMEKMELIKGIEVIYHRRNDEKLITSDRAESIRDSLLEMTPFAEFESNHDATGYFKNKVYDLNGGLIIHSQWIPAEGYSWSEEVIALCDKKSILLLLFSSPFLGVFYG